MAGVVNYVAGGVASRITRVRRRLTVVIWRSRRRTKHLVLALRVSLRRRQALVWHRLYWLRYRVLLLRARYGSVAAVVLVLMLVATSALWIPTLQELLAPQFAIGDRLQGLRTLLVTLGGALLGATAIVSSLVLFSVQVNVERMPHGLFRRLSADRQLIGAFAIAFLLAVFVAVLSLLPSQDWVGTVCFSAVWAMVLVLVLYLYGYRRALNLINPLRQLGLLVATTRREFRAWGRRAQRAVPLFSDPKPPRDDPFAPTHDLPRLAYFRANTGWTDGARQAVRYAVSFARRYAEQGDHEVSIAAMNAIVAVNAAYIEAKGKTFFTTNVMFDNPLTTDGFINDTLEHLRQTARIGMSRGDEQQIEQTFRGLAALAALYATIDYGSPNASKFHAHLAAGYLAGEVERVVPHKMPDVLMEGVRLIGQCATLLLTAEGPDAASIVVERLRVIAFVGVAGEDYRPATQACVEQLAQLSFRLLQTRSRTMRFAAKEIRTSMRLLAEVFLAVSEPPPSDIHSALLGPYYSCTSNQALSSRLVGLVNAVVEADPDNEDARQVIHNLAEWSDGMFETDKMILLEAIKRRSRFVFHLIRWISQTTIILLVASSAPACRDYDRGKLREHARWLIWVFSFIPDDLETVQFVETFQLTETIFDTALEARRRDLPDVAGDITKLLTWWMFKGGQHQAGWAILQRTVYGLAVLAHLGEADGAIETLKAEIGKRLAAGGLSDREVRDRAALEVRGRAANLWREGHWSSTIEGAMSQADHARLRPLLEELADLISPETAGQASTQTFF